MSDKIKNQEAQGVGLGNHEKLYIELENELSLLKKNSETTNGILNQQDYKLVELEANVDETTYQIASSKWLLNLLNHTFGKIYRKLFRYPKKQLNNQQDNPVIQQIPIDNGNSITDIISDIKSIHKTNNIILTNQNNRLDKIDHSITQNNQHILDNNKKIKDLINS